MRSIITSTTALALVTAALVLATSACGSGGGGLAAPPEWVPLDVSPPAEADVSGEHGGTLTWAEVGEVAVFNPLVTETAMESELKALVFDGLVAYDNADWSYDPALASEWEHSDDWLSWTFRLREGVRWSDGEPFTADDVLFSYAACCHPKIPNSTVSGFQVGAAELPKLVKVDDHTVRFDLSAVNALFLTQVANLRIMPAHIWATTIEGDEPTFGEQMKASDDLSKVVGTGPFRVVEYSGAQRVVYERNPHYWKVDRDGRRLPYVDRVIVLMAKDLTTRSVQFLNGDFDMITDIQPTDYRQFQHEEASDWFDLHRLGLSPNTNWLCFNRYPGANDEDKPFVEPHLLKLFENVEFRRAMSHAVDRDKLVRLFLRGKGEPIYSQTNQGNRDWFVPPERFPYDVAKARAMLDALGLEDRDGDGVREDADGNPIRFDLMTNVENPMRVAIIGQIRADWAAVGIDARTQPVNFQELVSQLMDGHDWDVILLGWGAGVPPDPLNGKNILLSSGRLHVWRPQQETPADAWEATGDRLINDMDREPDAKKRYELWKLYVAHETSSQPIVYLFSSNAYAATKKRVRNLRPSVLRPQTWWNVDELWLERER